ncbi:PREDICTED: heavy metal-associated isoprenylated plant protein 39-like [Ipomoea nil]|uniref:heavy metal-associated isoprenylated plant protein 39-like n=1 Tax=Ipomoea nil TaxID=35883 RepID=UPI00090142BC|nr:PREDICTED: heavy metal-associated isoprenylated plant protein 39-like [Ipomoea nil]XP_019158970.1 PREDICTED: heavy metal-associated isoprenylated plant protein 39-like [Ipomoea nil]
MAELKVVIKLEVNGERPASLAKRMGVGMLKAMLPFECVSKPFKHSAPENKSKAMQIAVGFHDVNSAALEGDGKDELVVKGRIDPVELVTVLRDKVGGAHIKSVGPADDKKEKEKKEKEEKEKKEKEEKEKKEKEEKEMMEKMFSSASVYPWPHQPLIYEVPDYNPRGCFSF